MKIGIIGHGMVGSTLSKYLLDNTRAEIQIYDPGKDYNRIISRDVDIVFICVPANTTESGKVDLTYVNQALNQCPENAFIMLKSTVLPGTADDLSRKYGKTIISCPEFLSRGTKDVDMEVNPVLFGGLSVDGVKIKELLNILKNCFTTQIFMKFTNTECELIKYSHNVFGAMKVNYFNMIEQLTEKLGEDYRRVRLGVTNCTCFISPHHTEVPGPDGKKGFGGPCLPKDTKAFQEFLFKHDFVLESSFLKDIQVINDRYRNDSNR